MYVYKKQQTDCCYLRAASKEQRSNAVAAPGQRLNAIAGDLVAPRQVQQLQHPAAVTGAKITAAFMAHHARPPRALKGGTCERHLRAFREWLLTDTQEVRSSCLSLEQNLLRLTQVLSVILVQPFRFSISMFLQFWAKVLPTNKEKKEE